MRKDIDKYWKTYNSMYGFEEVLRVYREKKAIDYLRNQNARKILEIGCGYHPLFQQYREFEEYTVIEPGIEPFKHALKVSKHVKKVNCILGHFEDFIDVLKEKSYDCILLPGVLHEVKQPESFLKLISEITEKGCSVYVNVPNAKSMHRELGKSMGVISHVYDKTERNLLLNQESVFDLETLTILAQKSIPRTKVIDSGTFFIKPFTHNQMSNLLKLNVIDDSLIEGLYQLSNVFPEHGSELFLVLQRYE